MRCRNDLVNRAPLVPKPLTNHSPTTARLDKRDFHYDAKRDRYRCPAGEYAIWRFTSIQAGMPIRKYWSSACPNCPIRSDCTTGDYRRVLRREHESVIERMQRRLDRMPHGGRLSFRLIPAFSRALDPKRTLHAHRVQGHHRGGGDESQT